MTLIESDDEAWTEVQFLVEVPLNSPTAVEVGPAVASTSRLPGSPRSHLFLGAFQDFKTVSQPSPAADFFVKFITAQAQLAEHPDAAVQTGAAVHTEDKQPCSARRRLSGRRQRHEASSTPCSDDELDLEHQHPATASLSSCTSTCMSGSCTSSVSSSTSDVADLGGRACGGGTTWYLAPAAPTDSSQQQRLPWFSPLRDAGSG